MLPLFTPPASAATHSDAFIGVSKWAPAMVAALFAGALAALLPPFSGPDESAHVAYVSALSQGHLPLLPAGNFADIATGTTWQAQHSPLFYALATPLYLLVGRDPLSGLYAMRALGVAAFVLTVLMVQALAGELLTPRGARATAWLVATHPVVAYVSAMANNESLAITLSTACVWAAIKARGGHNGHDAQRDKGNGDGRWLLLAAVIGGLGLLTKLTAIGGVLAAAWAAGYQRPSPSRWRRGALIVGLALAIWLPWGLMMRARHGTWVPSPVGQPALPGDLLMALLLPERVAHYLLLSLPDFTLGMVAPTWLMRTAATFNLTLAIAPLLLFVAWQRLHKRPDLRFVAVGFGALYLLLLNQIMFRDVHTMLFGARYSGAATVLAALLAGFDYENRTPRARSLLRFFWLGFSALVTLFLFLFFR